MTNVYKEKVKHFAFHVIRLVPIEGDIEQAINKTYEIADQHGYDEQQCKEGAELARKLHKASSIHSKVWTDLFQK